VNLVGTHNEADRITWLEQKLNRIPAGWRILDAGAGEQRFRPYCAHLSYVSQDFGQYDGVGDQRGLQTGGWDQSRLDIVSDITAIPELDGSFDAILCVEVLEHLKNPIAALQEFARLLRPGGQLILTAPFCSITHFAPYHFNTGFNRYFYETHLADNGFGIDEIADNGNFFEYLAQEVRRLPDVCQRYTSHGTGRLERVIMRGVLWGVLWLLARLSARDAGSSELLHFGCFVRATRQPAQRGADDRC